MKPDLELAQAFEDAIGRLWNGNPKLPIKGVVYSCWAVEYISSRAHKAIARVEPGLCKRSAAFNEYTVMGHERQRARALWLTLLAELAERGDLP